MRALRGCSGQPGPRLAALRLYQGVQDYWNRKGLVDELGSRKLAFGVLRDWYLERAKRAAMN